MALLIEIIKDLFMSLSIFIPNEWYYMLISNRDVSNDYAISIGSINRTAFYNIIQPINLVEFIYNYFYVSSIMILPILKFFSIKELFLLTLNIISLRILFLSFKIIDQIKVRFFISLFLSHLLVLFLFEPDLGSYLRHSSSIGLYLVSLLYYVRIELSNAKI